MEPNMFQIPLFIHCGIYFNGIYFKMINSIECGFEEYV